MSQYLGGASAPFSNCFFSFVYRYTGGAGRGGGEPKLTSTEKTTLQSIHRDYTEAQVIENQTVVENVSNRFNIRKAGNFTFSVTLDAEQIEIDKVNRAIQTATRWINVETSKNLKDVTLTAITANNIRDRPVRRILQNCSFLFDFLYYDPQGFDDEYVRDTVVMLDTSNPAIRQEVNIPREKLTQEVFDLRPDDTLRIEFSLNDNKLSPNAMRALNNAVDRFAEQAGNSRNPPEKRMNWIGVG